MFLFYCAVFGLCDSSVFVFKTVMFCHGSMACGDMFCYVRIGQVGFVMT